MLSATRSGTIITGFAAALLMCLSVQFAQAQSATGGIQGTIERGLYGGAGV